MKLDELIEKLVTIQREHGDLRVFIDDNYYTVQFLNYIAVDDEGDLILAYYPGYENVSQPDQEEIDTRCHATEAWLSKRRKQAEGGE
jgi:hypothetical protein